MSNCKKHECEQCVREEIKTLEDKIVALKKKLPATNSGTTIIYQGGCRCNHWQYTPYTYTNTTTTFDSMQNADATTFDSSQALNSLYKQLNG